MLPNLHACEIAVASFLKITHFAMVLIPLFLLINNVSFIFSVLCSIFFNINIFCLSTLALHTAELIHTRALVTNSILCLFLSSYVLAKIPKLTAEYIRQKCAGVHQINLAKEYMQLMADKGRKWVFRAAVEDNPKYYVVQIPSIRSRMQSNSTHTAYFLFDKNYLVDSMCTCENMARSIPCAHRGTALFAIMYKQQKKSLTPDPSRSVEQRKNIIIPDPTFEGGWKKRKSA